MFFIFSVHFRDEHAYSSRIVSNIQYHIRIIYTTSSCTQFEHFKAQFPIFSLFLRLLFDYFIKRLLDTVYKIIFHCMKHILSYWDLNGIYSVLLTRWGPRMYSYSFSLTTIRQNLRSLTGLDQLTLVLILVLVRLNIAKYFRFSKCRV